MQTFSMSFEDVLTLTPRRFWFLLNQIDRLRAEEQLLHLQILAAAGSGDGYKTALDGLTQQMGQIYVWEATIPVEFKVDPATGLDPEFDREGLRALKARHTRRST
jgi:hypothetical protein